LVAGPDCGQQNNRIVLEPTSQDRAGQLVKACKCKLGLGFDADGRQGLGSYGGGLPPRALQRSRLADAWLAPDQERAAAVRNVTNEQVDDLRLFVASDQLRCGHDTRLG
jgi:hypothetical protein